MTRREHVERSELPNNQSDATEAKIKYGKEFQHTQDTARVKLCNSMQIGPGTVRRSYLSRSTQKTWIKSVGKAACRKGGKYQRDEAACQLFWIQSFIFCSSRKK